MRVVFQQADLDTCVTAVVLGVGSNDDVRYRRFGALSSELRDPAVLCIEAGGSGGVDLNNFDHHNTSLKLPSASMQAFEACGRPRELQRLVEFAELSDTGRLVSPPPFPNISHLISGVRYRWMSDARRQFVDGVKVLSEFVAAALDPFSSLPPVAGWSPYLGEKRRRSLDASELGEEVDFVSKQGLMIGFAATNLVGAIGRIYQLGADVAVVHASSYGVPPISKHTIAGNGVVVDGLLPQLLAHEDGWGGPAHGTIIVSPRSGSRLTSTRVRSIVEDNAHLLLPVGNPFSRSCSTYA